MWVVYALILLVALTVLVLAVPVDLGLKVGVHGRPFVYLKVQWLFLRMTRTYDIGDTDTRSSQTRTAKQQKVSREKPWKKPAARAGRLVWDVLRIPGLGRNLAHLVVRLLHCIKARVVSIDFRAGLGDPADTALIVGGISQAVMFADMWSRHTFRLTPVFDGEAQLDGEAEVMVRLRPICTISPILGFLSSRSTLKAIVLVVRSRWKRE